LGWFFVWPLSGLIQFFLKTFSIILATFKFFLNKITDFPLPFLSIFCRKLKKFRATHTPNAHESEDSGMGLTYSVIRPDGTKRPSLTPPMMDLSGGVTMNASPKQAAGILNGNDGSRKASNQLASSNNSSNSNKSNLNYDPAQSANNTMNMKQSAINTTINNSVVSSAPSAVQQPAMGQQQTQINSTQASTQVTQSSNSTINSINMATRNLVSDYPRITSVEQRRRYKTEFDNDYAEYRQLHTVIEKVSNRFSQLEEELRNEANNDKKYKVGFFIYRFLSYFYFYFFGHA
jgi:hypothetical protein